MKFTKTIERMLIQSGLQFFTFMILADFALTLKDVKVLVPAAVKRGENVNLICQYDLEGDTLYSMKWYKGKREFFRFTPKENPSLQIFPVPGIYVETSKSNRSYITLKSVEPSISGKYSCEISAESPSFHTELVSSEMEIVDVPLNKPVITEIKSHYSKNELIRGNCTGQYSRPASNLTWLINDKPITTSIKQFSSIKDETRNLFSKTIGIFLRPSQQLFEHGRLKISCVASLYNLYREQVDRFIEEVGPSVHNSPSASQSLMNPSYYSPYHDNSDSINNHNDAQIQADMSSIATSVRSFISDMSKSFILVYSSFMLAIYEIALD